MAIFTSIQFKVLHAVRSILADHSRFALCFLFQQSILIDQRHLQRWLWRLTAKGMLQSSRISYAFLIYRSSDIAEIPLKKTMASRKRGDRKSDGLYFFHERLGTLN
jgi:hypothetical protein